MIGDYEEHRPSRNYKTRNISSYQKSKKSETNNITSIDIQYARADLNSNISSVNNSASRPKSKGFAVTTSMISPMRNVVTVKDLESDHNRVNQ